MRQNFRSSTLRQAWLAGLLLTPLPCSLAHGSVIPDWWTLTSGINFTHSSGQSQSTYTQFTQVQPDFVNSHGVAQSAATVATQYIIHILQNTADYTIAAQHHCDNTAGIQPRCISTGRIQLTTMTDVLVSASGSYSYQLPSVPMSAGLSFSASDYTTSTPQLLFLDSGVDDTFLSGPHNGTRTISISGVVPAGRVVRFTYTMAISFHSGAAQVPANGSGSIHFTMSAVPEPAALVPMLACALVMRRRRRGRA